MNDLDKKLAPVLTPLNMSVYAVEWLTNEKPPLLRVMVDKADGPVDLDACVAATDVISTALDELAFFESEYNLEVCSPGAERPLDSHEKRLAAVGSYVFVKLLNPKEGIDQTYGTLEVVNENTITISYRVKTRVKRIEIELDNIKELRTAVSV